MFAQPTKKHRKCIVLAARVMTLVGVFMAPMAEVASASDILWHNSLTNETQIWYMDGYKVSRRETVFGEDGKATFVGAPFSIVGISFDAFQFGDPSIIWHHKDTHETQFWGMFNYKVSYRQTALGETGSPTFIGPPFSIVGAGDFNGDLTARSPLAQQCYQRNPNLVYALR